MGNAFVRDINKAFGQSGQGGAVAGGDPDDWSPGARDPDYNPPSAPKVPPPPPVPKYIPPVLYSNRLAQEQGETRNDFNTSHQYLQRYSAEGGQHF